MTVLERFQHIACALMLGPIAPLYGIVELHGQLICECKKGRKCQTPGKHPRLGIGWKKRIERDLNVIHTWVYDMFPNGNFGVLMTKECLCIDLDFRPETGKDGPAIFEQLQQEYGPIPQTTIHRTGNPSARHIVFKLPDGISPNRIKSQWHGIDVIKRGLCVLPGSLHASGHYYQDEFPNRLPELAQIPMWLLNLMYTPDPASVPRISSLRSSSVEFDTPPQGSVQPGRLRLEGIVRRQLRRDRVAGRLFYDGIRRFVTKSGEFDRSKDDFALACKLAFYTSHNWMQFKTLFKASALYKDKAEGNLQYFNQLMDDAFLSCTANWKRKSRKKPGAKMGRPMTETTKKIVELVRQYPSA